jgi:hypothetical protein
MKWSPAIDQAVVLGSSYVRVFLKENQDASEEESLRRATVALEA